MAAESNTRNMVLCLTAVCLLCSAILAGIFAVTKAPIEEASRKALVEALSIVLPSDGEIDVNACNAELDGVQYEYYVQTVAGEPAAWAVKSTVNGFGGPLTVLVGIEKNGIVHATKVLEHSETPGLGAKCGTEESFYGQFSGFDSNAKQLKVKKDGGDVDAITASTITSRAYTLAVANAVKLVAGLQPKMEGMNNE